jgi:hypothetical protein
MKKFAEFMVKELGVKIPAGMALTNISHGSDRYVLYKVASVLSVSVSIYKLFNKLTIAKDFVFCHGHTDLMLLWYLFFFVSP